MGRPSNRDVDDLTQMQYEDALSDEEPWAMEAHAVHRWMALDGKRVRVENDEEHGPIEGVWQWKGQTAEDFWLVYINDDEGRLIVGTDPRNFDVVTVLDA